jgi:DNA-binding CsgD family transcriptional regulator
VANILLLTPSPGTLDAVFPVLDLLPHHVQVAALSPAGLTQAQPHDIVLLDARTDLAAARPMARLLASTGLTSGPAGDGADSGPGGTPLVLLLTEGGLPALSADWGAADFIVDGAGPAEVDARLRVALARAAAQAAARPEPDQAIVSGDLAIDPGAYTARLRGRLLDLTYKEFELLRYLAANPSHVFTRAQLLQEVWGYDYYGGTRTVDVHVRRLRAKLGPEYEYLIATVRNVGYRFTPTREA